MSIEQIKEDTYVRTKLVELRIRSGEVIVTRLFSRAVHQPLVIFSVDESGVVPHAPQKIKSIGDAVSFDTESGIHGDIKTNGTDSMIIRVGNDESKIGIMFPSIDADCFFADQMEPIDKRFTTIASYLGNSDDPTHQHLSLPMLHLVHDESCLSVSTREPTKSVEFCHFVHEHLPYFNAISTGSIKVAFRCFGNKRAAINHFYHQHGYVQPLPISGHLNLPQMKEALYTNATIQDPHQYEAIFLQALETQKKLDNHDVRNCIIGSLAVATHKPDTEVHDIDIAVHSLSEAKIALKDHEIKVADSGKWKDCAFRVQTNSIQADIVELKRFDWTAITERKGLKILNEQGLLTMKLMGEFERSLMQPNYDVFKVKNQKSILSLFDHASYVYPFFAEFLKLDVEENFRKLKSLMQDAAWDHCLVTATFPLHANAFVQGEETFIPIVNNGSPCAGKIWINKPMQHGTWIGLDGNDHSCTVNSTTNHTEIQVPVVEDVGILVCHA